MSMFSSAGSRFRTQLCTLALLAGLAPAALAAIVITPAQTFSLDENEPAATVVGTVATTGAGANPQFSLANGFGVFTINATTGEITTIAGANFEAQASYTLSVTAEDDDPSTDTEDVTVNIGDVNEDPVINDQGFNIDEDAAIGTSLGNILASDPDVGDTITFDVTGGTGAAVFDVDPTTGEITTLVALDAETEDQYTLTVEVEDLGSETDTATITIDVNDQNEPPVINNQNFNTAEDAAIGTSVGNIVASDPDVGDTITFDVTGGTGAAVFDVNPTTGEITTLVDLDAETEDQYTLIVEVEDSSNETDSATITIDVDNENEAPTVSNQSFSVDEDVAIGATVGTVAASDPDVGDVLEYTVTGGTGAAVFDLDLNSGEITTAAALDFETEDSYTLNVRVEDVDGLFDTATITVNINDTAEGPSINPQTFDVDENEAIGTSVGTVVATDPDGGATLTYAINPASTQFAIDANTGEITTLQVLDHEADDQYTITVVVTDDTTLTDSAAITIDINDLNEAPTVNNQTFAVDENVGNGTAVGTVVASDPDAGDSLDYSITGGTGAAVFEINASTGQITTDAAIDFETEDSYSLTVQVEDGDNETDTATITININNLAEAPVINPQTFDIDEDEAIGSTVGTVVATDQDAGDTLTYSITGGTGVGTFDIDDNSGAITTLAALDFETTTQYTLTVQVEDTATLTDSATITIDINDVNEAPTATCIAGPIVLDSTTNCDNTITAADLDNGSSDPDAGDSLTLTISPSTPLPPGPNIVTLTVTDSGGLFDTCDVTVTVLGTDCNNNGQPDSCDLQNGTSEDCNLNLIPDECDIASNASPDGNTDGVPDECAATDLFVDINAAGAGHGVNWANASTNLRAMLVIASNPTNAAQRIHVAAGTYTPHASDRAARFEMYSGLSILGGYATGGGSRNAAVNITTLSGEIGAAGAADNSFNVVRADGVDGTALLEGFTIEAGNADGPIEPQWGGGGLATTNGSPVIRQVRFFNNRAINSGGAVQNINGNPTFDACVFDTNTARQLGGAIYTRGGGVNLIDSTMTGNSAVLGTQQRGGAIAIEGGTVAVENSTLENNTAAVSGGAISQLGGSLLIRESRFENNSSDIGGAIELANGAINAGNSEFVGNDALVGDGGAILIKTGGANPNLSLTNCILFVNTAGGNGAGVHADGDATIAISNCTIAGNNSVTGAGGLSFTGGFANVANSILWRNRRSGTFDEAAQITATGGSQTITYTAIEGLTALAGNGNIGGDPLFVDFAGGNLRLTATSPCLDVGNNDVLPADTLDLDNDLDSGEPLPVDFNGNRRRAQVTPNTGNGTAPFTDLGAIESDDCNGNSIPDGDEIAATPSIDCNTNGRIDSCEVEADCDGNGRPDECDLTGGAPDCNNNGIPDGCDITSNTSADCNNDDIPDECAGQDLDGDGFANGGGCDDCPNDPAKQAPGACGCGVIDEDSDGDSVSDCDDQCPGLDDTADGDGDGTADCLDGCPLNPDKTEPGECGCSTPDTDADNDGVVDCDDNCVGIANGDQADADGDGRGDACDNCPAVPNPDQTDSDGDRIGNDCDPTPFPVTPGNGEDDNGALPGGGDPPGQNPPPPPRPRDDDDAVQGPGPGAGSGLDSPDPQDNDNDNDGGEPEPSPTCGAGACGAGVVPMMPLLLAAMFGMKATRRRYS